MNSPRESVEHILIRLGDAVVDDLATLKQMGRIASEEQGIQIAVDQWLRSEIDRYILRGKQYETALRRASESTIERRTLRGRQRELSKR